MSPFIVAEMSASHLGSLRRALDIVDAAAEAGADAVKTQTWSPGAMCIDKGYTLESGPWAGRRLADLYEEAFLPWEWHAQIFQHARARGLIPFSAAFDCAAVDFLETLGVDRHKVSSFELVDIPLIEHMASKGKPMILSTGMATRDEIDRAIRASNWNVTLLKCTSAYPAEPAAANLSLLRDWWRDGWNIGLSDHTLTSDCAVVATALGASMIEKHLTLRRADGGPDAGFALEPREFADMVQAVRRAAATLGEPRYGPGPGEDPDLRRSLWVKRPIAAGEPLRLGDNVVTARPASGLACHTPLEGLRAARDLAASTPLRYKDVA